MILVPPLAVAVLIIILLPWLLSGSIDAPDIFNISMVLAIFPQNAYVIAVVQLFINLEDADSTKTVRYCVRYESLLKSEIHTELRRGTLFCRRLWRLRCYGFVYLRNETC